MQNFLYVALGGALGAVGRYGVGLLVLRAIGAGFPWATLMVNLLGCFAMGIVAVALSDSDPKSTAFWMAGVLGGFTTYSAFSLDAFRLFEHGQYGFAALYVLGTLVGALCGVALGIVVARNLFA